MSNQGSLIVVSGFSGAGKGTVMKAMLDKFDNYVLSVSATTRAPRQGEIDGVSYFFKSVEEFKEMIEDGELLEYARYVDNYYGTPKEYVVTQMGMGHNVFLEIETVGALKIKELFPEAVLIFITPPSAAELESRLRGRGTEDEATIRARLAKAHYEAEGVENYDYIVINDTVNECVTMLDMVARQDKNVCEGCKAANNIELINKIREDLKVFAEGDI